MKHLLVRTAALLVVACGCGDDENNHANNGHDNNHHNTDDLADCTGEVPMDAVSCRLDLGTGVDTYWADTDGVDPGTAGCHDEFTTDTCGEVKPGRTFGEFCLDTDRLVESNPGADECHTHGGDLGKPDVVSCSAWCEGEGASGGSCEGDIETDAAEGTCMSARCVCDT